ncbi:hypothetical protein SALB1_0456 [Salinisphaera sp. LB1]|nr:hypothetical protein SALB1_0456 [Salinisphaera sp. LB1]
MTTRTPRDLFFIESPTYGHFQHIELRIIPTGRDGCRTRRPPNPADRRRPPRHYGARYTPGMADATLRAGAARIP